MKLLSSSHGTKRYRENVLFQLAFFHLTHKSSHPPSHLPTISSHLISHPTPLTSTSTFNPHLHLQALIPNSIPPSQPTSSPPIASHRRIPIRAKEPSHHAINANKVPRNSLEPMHTCTPRGRITFDPRRTSTVSTLCGCRRLRRQHCWIRRWISLELEMIAVGKSSRLMTRDELGGKL